MRGEKKEKNSSKRKDRFLQLEIMKNRKGKKKVLNKSPRRKSKKKRLLLKNKKKRKGKKKVKKEKKEKRNEGMEFHSFLRRLDLFQVGNSALRKCFVS